MTEETLTKLLLGTLLGILATLAGLACKIYLERKAEREREHTELRRKYLRPLLLAARDFRKKFHEVAEQVDKEKAVDGDALEADYNLRYWLNWCKDFIVEPSTERLEADRLVDIAMHSGGVGCQAISTLYITAFYLHYATSIRLQIATIELEEQSDRLVELIEHVRSCLSGIEFYVVTQDSTGASMQGQLGTAMNYREFCEALALSATRPWFLTLADVFTKLHRQKPEDIAAVLQALDELTRFLKSRVK